MFKIGPSSPRGQPGRPYILQTYSPLEIYCKSPAGGFEFGHLPSCVNKPNGLWKFATFDVCVCCLRFFCSSEVPSRLGRFRFYLSKVFHSVVIVWVARPIVAKANIYLGWSLLSISRYRDLGHCAANWICGTRIKCCRKEWLRRRWHYQKIDRQLITRETFLCLQLLI